MKDLPIVSVIIPTYNSARTLEYCLESVRNQDYKGDIEIIIVDNFSDDGTIEIAKQVGIKFIKEKSGRSKARNTGANLAHGKYILYLDSDMCLSKTIISECVNILESDQNKVALYIPEKIVGNNFWTKVRDFEREFHNATCTDSVRFIRMDIFKEINGFDENLIGGEDWDFDRRIKEKGKTDIIKSCLYHDERKFSILDYLKKKKMYADTLNKYVEKWGQNDPVIKKQLSAKYRLMGIFIENGKWKKLIRKPHLAFATFGLRCLVGLCYLTEKIK